MDDYDTETELPFSQEMDYQDLKSMISLNSQDMQELVKLPLSESIQNDWSIHEIEHKIQTPITISPTSNLPYSMSNQQVCSDKIFTSRRSIAIPEDISSLPGRGRYMFNVIFEEESSPPKKSCPFTWSESLSCLFVQPNVDASFNFVTKIPLPKNSVIKAFLVYTDDKWRETPVETCPNHQQLEVGDLLNLMIQKRNKGCYETCPFTNRHILSFSPSWKPSHVKFVEELKFKCASSCKGGIDKRALSIVFVLVISGKIEGHVCFGLFICSCPGRDRTSKERKKVMLKMATDSKPDMLRHTEQPLDHSKRKSLWHKNCESSKRRIVHCSNFEYDNRLYVIKLPPIRGIENVRALGEAAVAMGIVKTLDELVLKNLGSDQSSDGDQLDKTLSIHITSDL